MEAAPSLIAQHEEIQNGDTLDEVLARAGVSSGEQRYQILDIFNKAYDVRKVRAGRELLVEKWEDSGAFDSLEYQIDPDHKIRVQQSDAGPQAEIIELAGKIELTPVCAVMQDSLFMTMQRAGEGDELTIRMADILKYDVDFIRDPQPGDEFCVLVEKKFYDNGQPFTYKRILAAKYMNMGVTYDAFLFPDEKGKEVYISHDGRALVSTFLRAPLPFDARVSSHFSRNRLHPVLGVHRAHLGTDYAAPIGTPVLAVADGKVLASGYTSGNGNYVQIAHANGYVTYYLHFSKRLVAAGQHVTQGQKIGLVGATGLASGPHLDIRISQNGKWLDWEHMKPQRNVTLTKQQLDDFAPERDRLMAMMDSAPKTIVVDNRYFGDPASRPPYLDN